MRLFASCDACFDINLGKISAKSRQNLGKISAKVFEVRRGHAAVNGRPGLKSLSQKVI
jgi:hypothetical protein